MFQIGNLVRPKFKGASLRKARIEVVRVYVDDKERSMLLLRAEYQKGKFVEFPSRAELYERVETTSADFALQARSRR